MEIHFKNVCGVVQAPGTRYPLISTLATEYVQVHMYLYRGN